ncbi:hypothetical protein [Leuconostoc pseudomesenteroides]|uniref:hypothetical protein n=1 Tax=Leuconostoc pseudomesenteroides TaxID=33968 RepID=UPI0039E92A4F
MTIEEYTKQKNERLNRQAAVSGSFTKCFNNRAQSERNRLANRKRYMRALVEQGITDIDLLAQYLMISAGTVRKNIYAIGYRVERGSVMR